MHQQNNVPVIRNKYSVSRLGRKLAADDQKLLIALPREVIPERIWAEVLQKEDIELMILEIREEVIGEALRIGYEKYMERQVAPFTAYCAAQAWLKLIDWHFMKHDPGEDPTAYPLCWIPKREESWCPDKMPDPSPMDSFGQANLNVVEEIIIEEPLRKFPSLQSLDEPVVEEIPKECWFPGKVLIPGYTAEASYIDTITFDGSESSDMATESELLQKVTNYSPEDSSINKESTTLMTTSSPNGATSTAESTVIQGEGDSATPTKIRAHSTKSRILGRSRLDTQYEILPEKIDSSLKVNVKRK